MKKAIAGARDVEMEGRSEEGVWMVELVRDAYVAKREAERRREIFKMQTKLNATKQQCFVRKEMLGVDRDNNKVVQFDYDDYRIWVCR